ncbi:MAG: serine hydrolase [Patescibacteria group bacterium]
MKQFFQIVFGGLAAIGGSMGIIFGSAWLWRNITPVIANIHFSSFVAATELAIIKPAPGTVVSGFKRIIRYTALEEEDLINAATLALPLGADNRVTADGYIVKNLTVGGSVVIEHNSDKSMPIASLSKLVTAIVARQLIDPNKKITLTKEITATYGNTAQFRTGETFLAKDLYYPLLMISSNDAAEAFARNYGRKAFLQSMNDFVQSIGAYRTYFADPSGLSPDNVSTANDLAIILNWIRLNDPEILNITKLKAKNIKLHTWVNPTHFLSWSNYLGGKNGYTPEANRTGVALFTMGSRKNVYVIVVLGSAMRDADMVKLLRKIRE